ncbi:MAG: hypothetical protein GYA02_15950 [Clostridiaceae bacterium]|nr:hypothetical protein [Clostridiaceae bacterium]
MNLSLDETISLLTIMREASGRTGQEVGNALNSILSYIQRPGSINALESMGINMFADSAKTQFRNVMDIFKDIASQWKTSSDVIKDGFVQSADEAGLFNEELATALGLQEEWNDLQQRDIAQASAGVYRRNYFIGMIERLSNAQGVLNGMMDASGYSMRENERTMDTLEKKYQSLKTSAEQLAVALGDAGLLDLLKDIVDAGTNVTSAIAGVDDEMKALLTTALELIAVIGSIKAISGLFTDKNLLLGAGALLPGWTKLLVIVPSVIAAISLYANNLKNTDTVVRDFTERKDKLTKSYESAIEAIEETKESMLGEAKTAEILAEKLEELTQKEELNVAEKEQLKVVVDQLNDIFPNLSLAIDEQTGKIIGNTTAIYDNIAALREQALAQAYKAKMQATANAYVEQEIELEKVRKQIRETQGEIYASQGKQTQAELNAQAEIDALREKGYSKRTLTIKENAIRKKYGITDAKMDINKAYDTLNSLKTMEAEYAGLLEGLDAELEGWMNKVTETSSKVGGNDYVPTTPSGTSSSTGTTASGSYRNTALENALKVLDYKRYINELTLEDELKMLYEIKANHVNTADELMEINKRIYTAEQKLLDEKKNSYKLEERNIQHLAKLGVYSVEQQIEAYRELYSVKAESLADEQSRVENLFNLYKQLLSEEQRKIKDAYNERIDLIDEEAKRKKENLEDEKKAIQEQLNLLDRKDNERSYKQTMQGLQDELKYWSVRTSEEARKKVIEIQEQIEEEKYKHELEKQKQSLQDKIDVLDDEIDEVERVAEEEKKKWEKSYKQIEKAFDTHSTNIVALAGAMSKEAYQEWVNNYLVPLQSALSSGNYDMFDNLSGGLGGSIDKLDSRNSINAQIYQAAKAILSLKKQWTDGDASAAQKATQYYNQLRGLGGKGQSVADFLSASNYEDSRQYVNNLPKFHDGGKVLSDGKLIAKKGEMILTPDLSLKMEGLLNFLRGSTTFNKTSTSNAYDNRKEVKIDRLVNIERNIMEDEVDSDMFAREINRLVKSII